MLESIRNVFRSVGPHGGWPYPRGKAEVKHVTFLFIACVVVAIVLSLWSVQSSSDKTLKQADIQQIAEEVSSYSSETLVLIDGTQGRALSANYRKVYAQKLKENLTKADDKLKSHPIEPGFRAEANRISLVIGQLKPLVNNLIDMPVGQNPDKLRNTVEKVNQNAIYLVGSLV